MAYHNGLKFVTTLVRAPGQNTMSTRPPTMKDVADLAGVSKMAVSVVLNDTKSTVGVSAATRTRILKALEELQYQPNAHARSLRLKRTNIIGVYSGVGFIDTRDPFIRELFHGLTEGLTAYRKDLLVYSSLNLHRRNSLLERVLSSKIDAAIVLPNHYDSPLLNELRRGRVPCVTVADEVEGLRSVTADDEGGSRFLADYLLSQGHRCILYRRSVFVTPADSLRFNAFRSKVEAGGGRVISHRALEPRDSVTDVEEALLMDRRGEDRVTAVACWRDYSAVRVLNFCRMRGLVVPGGIAVVGFDGLQHASTPPGFVLTTVDAHWRAVAHAATDRIAAMLTGDDSGPRKAVIPADLTVGNTA